MGRNATTFYTETNPGADSTERTIFDSNADVAYKTGAFLNYGIAAIGVHMDWDTGEAQTLKSYYYPKDSTTAVPMSEESITCTTPDDQYVEIPTVGLWGVKITLTNDGSAKTKHNVSLTFIQDSEIT